MITEEVPSIDLNNSQDIARIKKFLPYQPFSVRVNKSFFYYAFLGIRREEYVPCYISDKNVVSGVSSISIEVIYLGALSYEEISLPFYSQSSELFTKIAKAQWLCKLKREVETGQPICGLRISGESLSHLDEIKQKFDGDIIL